MGKSTDQVTGHVAELIDDLQAQQKVLGRAQARRAQLMVEFSELRTHCDRRVIAQAQSVGGDARYSAGEFGSMEIGLAVRESKYSVQKVLGMSHRLRAEAPDCWDAWLAGDISQDKAIRINRALRLLVRDGSKQLLNHVVVDVAVCKTPELLGRWLNQFIARVEPDQTDERMRRSLADRNVSVRPDVDGISFMHAMMSSVDAVAIDQVLTAVASLAEPGDSRNLQQRRADALVDMLLGRISNGCATRWDTNSDAADDEETGAEEHGAEEHGADKDDADKDDADKDDADKDDADEHDADKDDADENDADENDADNFRVDGSGEVAAKESDVTDSDRVDASAPSYESVNCTITASGGQGADEWELPASAYRPDPPRGAASAESTERASGSEVTGSRRAAERVVRGIEVRPVQVNIGIVISAASLFGFSNTPGELMDRSALVSADVIRNLAARPGTLFHRLITDERGNLLDVTELGRFPSRKLGLAISYRDGGCTNPICTVPSWRCDHDHVVPKPEGPTSADNLDDKCRPDHRAKTHAGHRTRRTGPHTGEWITPTEHSYETRDDPLPVEPFPDTC